MVLALSYSSQWEVQRAVQNMAQDAVDGKLKPSEITNQTINQYLQTNFMPEPELLIRTGGEQRLSNFLLLQSAYSELYFTQTFWPDFDEDEFCKAIYDYQQRERRFGKTSEQVENQ